MDHHPDLVWDLMIGIASGLIVALILWLLTTML